MSIRNRTNRPTQLPVRMYALSDVPAGLELNREISGNREDQPVENGPVTVHLKEDEHFHSGPPKTYRIIVNGEQKEVTAKTVSFGEIVKFGTPCRLWGTTFCIRSSYEDGPPANPQAQSP